MLGKSRIDAPGALHHVIERGIDRRKIFLGDTDRNNFLDRLGDIVTDTKVACKWGQAIVISYPSESSLL
jgi:hypothetical protein